MTTDRLIDVLSANLEPVVGNELRKAVIEALIAGGAAALGEHKKLWGSRHRALNFNVGVICCPAPDATVRIAA